MGMAGARDLRVRHEERAQDHPRLYVFGVLAQVILSVLNGGSVSARPNAHLDEDREDLLWGGASVDRRCEILLGARVISDGRERFTSLNSVRASASLRADAMSASAFCAGVGAHAVRTQTLKEARTSRPKARATFQRPVQPSTSTCVPGSRAM